MPSADVLLSLAKEGLLLTLIITAPPVLAAMGVGLIISILQATTQIQEQTLTFVPKLITIVLVLAFAGDQMFQQLVTFTNNLLTKFPYIVQ